MSKLTNIRDLAVEFQGIVVLAKAIKEFPIEDEDYQQLVDMLMNRIESFGISLDEAAREEAKTAEKIE